MSTTLYIACLSPRYLENFLRAWAMQLVVEEHTSRARDPLKAKLSALHHSSLADT